MYTSYIGKKFLRLYRERNGLPDDYSARQFFDEVFFPVFFNDEQHLMHVHGSSFFQKVGKDFIKTGKPEPILRLERLHEDINNGVISGSTYVAYAAGGITQPTSGQVTSMNVNINSEEMYASWIGEGLAVGLEGGIILLEEEEIFWALFDGWKHYRRFLTQTPNVKDKQIETWNGHWICHVFSKNFDPTNVLAGFVVNVEIKKDEESNSSIAAIPTKKWVEIVFALARKYPNRVLTANAYVLSKMNKTFGFINFSLPQVSSLVKLKEIIYTYNDNTNSKNIEDMYETYFRFNQACQFGVIGLKTLEPDKLRQFMPSGSITFAGGKDFKFKTDNDYFQYQIFKTWIIAMLSNKTELNVFAERVAQALIDFEDKNKGSDAGRGKSTQDRLSQEVQSSKTLREFIDNLTKVMKDYAVAATTFKEVKDGIIQLPADLFPLFITLIRFEYQFKKSTNS